MGFAPEKRTDAGCYLQESATDSHFVPDPASVSA